MKDSFQRAIAIAATTTAITIVHSATRLGSMDEAS